MDKRNWSDQPVQVEEAEVLLSSFCSPHLVEVRRRPDGGAYVSVGNLFGSQTVSVHGLEDAFRILNVILHAKDGAQVRLPEYAELVENDKKE